jgi:hypothetical protein
LHQPILRKLGAYRARIRNCVTAEGASYLVAVLVGLVFLSLLIDYFQRLDLFGRVFALLVGLGTLGYLGYRFLVSRLARPMDDERVAQTVEDHFPELGDRVISALQFSTALSDGHTGRSGESLMMMSAVSSDAVAAIDPIDLNSTIDYARVFKAMLLAFVCCVGLGMMCLKEVQGVNVMGRWFQRNILLQNIPWPQRTHLRVDYPAVLPRGDAMTVTVVASGEIPDLVSIRYKFQETGRHGEEVLARTGQFKDNQFRTRFKNVVEPLKFKVYGGDAESEWYSVTLVQRPTMTQLKFRAVYPHYTNRASSNLKATESYLEVLPGTVIRVTAVPSKSLRAAWLAVDGAADSTAMTRVTDQKEIDFWFSKADQERMKKMADEGTSSNEVWTASLRASEDCSVAVMARDTNDLVSKPPTRFTIRIDPDRAPTVTCRLKGIGEMICKNATLPMDIRTVDDFGIKQIRLVHKFVLGETPVPEEVIPFKKLRYGDAKIENEYRWDLKDLGLQPGSVFVFRVEATDFKDTKPLNVGKAETTSLRVVKAEELMADLVRRQVEQRQDFVRNRDRVRDEVKIEVDAAGRTLREKGALAKDQKGRLAAIAQTLLHAAQEIRHTADVLEQVYLEMVNNKLGDEAERSRLKDGIVTPCHAIAATMMPKLSEAITAATKETAAGMKKAIPATAQQTDVLLKEMDLVLNNMLRIETMRRIIEQAIRVREMQEGLLTEIEKERLELLRSILGD